MTTKKKKPVTRHSKPKKPERKPDAASEELPELAGGASASDIAGTRARVGATAEIDTAAFDAHAAAKAEGTRDAIDDAPPLGEAAVATIDAVLGAAQAEARAVDDAPTAPVPDAPLFDGPAPVDPAAGEPRKGGWPKGRPRDPVERAKWDAERGLGAGAPVPPRESVAGRVEGDPVKRARSAERENADLKRENADLRARVDANTHEVIRKGLGALIVMVSNIGARKYGEHMRVPVEEANECGAHVGNALIPFLGDYSRYMPLVIAVSACAAVAIPRLQYEEEIREGKRPRIMLDGSTGPKIIP